MSISYPLDVPEPLPSRVTLGAREVSAVVQSPFSLRTQIQKLSGESWLLSATLPPMKRSAAAAWEAFFLALNGPAGTFRMLIPQQTEPRGTVPGTPLVNGAGQSGHALATDGWTANQSGILLVGDLIQVGDYLYRVLEDASSNASGQSTLTIWPRLRSAPADNASVVTDEPKGLWRLSPGSLPSWDISADGVHYCSGFQAIEAI